MDVYWLTYYFIKEKWAFKAKDEGANIRYKARLELRDVEQLYFDTASDGAIKRDFIYMDLVSAFLQGYNEKSGNVFKLNQRLNRGGRMFNIKFYQAAEDLSGDS